MAFVKSEELECPKCHEIYPDDRKKCRCGHVFSTGYSNKTCAWTGCTLMGTLSDGLRGGGTFYCRWHYFSRHDPQVASQLTEQINRGEIGPDKTDWRDRYISDFQKDHPEFAVIPDAGEESEMMQMAKRFLAQGQLPKRKRGYVPGDIPNEQALIDELEGRYEQRD